jgi:environmental stress-induced protein Ves
VARHVVARREPYAFAGDWRTTCRVLDGPVHVLNVMTRRGRFDATVEIRSGPGTLERHVSEIVIAVDLCSLDAWLFDDASPLEPPGGDLAIVRLRPARR